MSTAAVPFSEEALSTLLERSQANNARLGLTGLLLYKDGQFMPALPRLQHLLRRPRGSAATWATSARAKWLLEWFRHRQV